MKFIGFLLFVIATTGYALPQEDYVYDDSDLDGVAYDEETAPSTEPEHPPEFNVQPQVFTPLEGESVSFPCTSDRDSEYVLIIQREPMEKPSDEILLLADNVFFIRDARYSIKDNIFTINNVKRTDTSHYVCYYQYNGQRINVTHTLDVHYEPIIRRKQKTIETRAGETAAIECRAKGNPMPQITWKKQGGEMPSGKEQETGTSIEFLQVDRHVAGSYMCTAANGVGNPATATRDIIVYYPPQITTENELVHSGEGDRVELVCVVHAFPAAEVQWMHNGSPVDADTRAEVHDGGHRHLLTIEGVSNNDMGQYMCIASNSEGSVEKEISLTDAPSTPSITSEPNSAYEDSYTLTFTTHSYYPITHYKLMYRKIKANDSTDQPGEWQEVSKMLDGEEETSTSTEHNFQYNLENLEGATDYEGHVSVWNSVKPAQEAEFFFSTSKEMAGHHKVSSATLTQFSYLTSLVAFTSAVIITITF